MSPILEAALELQAFCQAQGWRYYFIGGIKLDEPLIFGELEPLLELKGAPEAATRLREILRGAR